MPVKLRVYESLFVPMAKWSMLMTGNYRCVTDGGVRPIAQAVHDDLDLSREIYAHIDAIAQALGAEASDLVRFEKYAKAATGLLKPSSAARAILAGNTIERVDLLIQQVAQSLGRPHPEIDRTVARIDAAIQRENKSAA